MDGRGAGMGEGIGIPLPCRVGIAAVPAASGAARWRPGSPSPSTSSPVTPTRPCPLCEMALSNPYNERIMRLQPALRAVRRTLAQIR